MTDHPHEAVTLETLEAICRSRGGRLTRQRRTVLAKLLGAARPMTAYELLDAVRPEDASATPASIYRTLDFLLEHGLAHRLETTRSFVACEHPDHAHAGQFLICRQCGTVVETKDTRVNKATKSLSDRLGFTLEQKTVELTGTCAMCQTGPGPSS